MKVYLIGSLRNEKVPALGRSLRRAVPEATIFDDWFAAGPEADDKWKDYEQARGREYEDALGGFAAKNVFAFDKGHLDSSTHAVLVLPAGKSGHMEVMYAQYGAKLQCAILLEPDTDPRWDVMYQFIPNVFRTAAQLEEWLHATNPDRVP